MGEGQGFARDGGCREVRGQLLSWGWLESNGARCHDGENEEEAISDTGGQVALDIRGWGWDIRGVSQRPATAMNAPGAKHGAAQGGATFEKW